MTNFAACRSKRSFIGRANALHQRDTQSRATNRVVGTAVLTDHNHKTVRILPTSNGQQKTSEWNCGASIYSGHSSSTLNSSRASSTTTYHPNSILSNRSQCGCSSRASSCGHQTSDQTSVISSNYLVVKSLKCSLCKEKIQYFKEEYICGHSFHGECIWRFEKLNPLFDTNNCPKQCQSRPMIKRTRSIESHASSKSSSSTNSTSSNSSSGTD